MHRVLLENAAKTVKTAESHNRFDKGSISKTKPGKLECHDAEILPFTVFTVTVKRLYVAHLYALKKET
jgi:hypothetical protein